MERGTRDRQVLERGQEHPDELVFGVPMTFVSENHGCVVVHRGIDFPSSGSVATSIEYVRSAHFDTKIMPRIKPMWFDDEMTGKHNSCREMRWSLRKSEWKSNSKHADDMMRPWRLMLGSKETDAGHEGDGKTTRHR